MTKLTVIIFSLCILCSALVISDAINQMRVELAKQNSFQAEYTKLAGAVPMSQLVAMRGK